MMRLKGKAGRQGSAYFAPLRLQTFGFRCQTPLMGSNHRLFAQAAERDAAPIATLSAVSATAIFGGFAYPISKHQQPCQKVR